MSTGPPVLSPYQLVMRFPARLRAVLGRMGAWAGFSPAQPLLMFPPRLGFTLRTAFGCLLALGLAYPLEMGSPGWAPLICWAVSLTGGGESLSKARWCIMGTLLGVVAGIAITAFLPQAPWLFLPILALWTGMCLFFGSFASNFRTYGWGLAGFTTVIVAMNAIPDGNTVFWLGMSRGTNIILGVMCSRFSYIIFTGDPAAGAWEKLRQNLEQSFGNVCRILGAALEDQADTRRTAETEITRILAADAQIEFLAIELRGKAHAGPHAHATLAALASALARIFGAPLHYPLVRHYQELVESGGRIPPGVMLFHRVREMLQRLPENLFAEPGLQAGAAERAEARGGDSETLSPSGETPLILGELSELRSQALALAGEVEVSAQAQAEAEEVLMLTVLANLLSDIEIAARQLRASLGYDTDFSLSPRKQDTFRFPHVRWRDPVLAMETGLKVSTAVMVTSLIYEVTAWPEGKIFVTFTSIICCLFGTSPTPAMGSFGFLAGMLAAAASAFVLDVILIPCVEVYEGMILCYLPMLLLPAFVQPGKRTGAWMGVALIAYGFMIFPMTVKGNHQVMNALEYFNRVQAMVLASMIAILIFRIVFPYSLRRAANRIRLSMLRELRHICRLPRSFRNGLTADKLPRSHFFKGSFLAHLPSERLWIARSLGRFSHLSIHTPKQETAAVQAYLFGLLSTMSLGLSIIRLQHLLAGQRLPAPLAHAVLALLKQLRRNPGDTVAAAKLAGQALVALDQEGSGSRKAQPALPDTLTPQDRALVAGCLLAIERVLLEDRSFLCQQQPPVAPVEAFPPRPVVAR
ncbi:FUSC family protein [Oecophyllibacter saccharovorans]|uniref:FUSC family protein n=1 Tax=Oecophyllibacter saccharovorans TaxID=2558360 RepID=UPI0011740713|nr:FUSC family protein [Oecophyllibacter saccharovorans]TPW35238.1 FUSC family protein [Oecophyllibacter saccharovorans]